MAEPTHDLQDHPYEVRIWWGTGSDGSPWGVWIPPFAEDHLEDPDHPEDSALLAPYGDSYWPSLTEAAAFVARVFEGREIVTDPNPPLANLPYEFQDDPRRTPSKGPDDGLLAGGDHDYNVCEANSDGVHGPLEQAWCDLPECYEVRCVACGVTTTVPLPDAETLEWN